MKTPEREPGPDVNADNVRQVLEDVAEVMIKRNVAPICVVVGTFDGDVQVMCMREVSNKFVVDVLSRAIRVVMEGDISVHTVGEPENGETDQSSWATGVPEGPP